MPAGRPTQYKPEYADMAKEIIRYSGFSIPKLAKVFNVNRATVYNWMGEHEEFLDGVRQGRKIFDGITIERSLVRRATGFRWTETTQEPNEEGELVVTKKVKKFVPPDVAAIRHWQINMDSAHWSDKRQIEHTGEVTLSGLYDKITDNSRTVPGAGEQAEIPPLETE